MTYKNAFLDWQRLFNRATLNQLVLEICYQDLVGSITYLLTEEKIVEGKLHEGDGFS